MDELLSIFQSSDFELEIFPRHLTARKQCFWLVSEEADGDPESAGFSQEVTKFRALGSSIQPVLYRNDVVSV